MVKMCYIFHNILNFSFIYIDIFSFNLFILYWMFDCQKSGNMLALCKFVSWQHFYWLLRCNDGNSSNYCIVVKWVAILFFNILLNTFSPTVLSTLFDQSTQPKFNFVTAVCLLLLVNKFSTSKKVTQYIKSYSTLQLRKIKIYIFKTIIS